MITMRLRTRSNQEEIKNKVGKIIGEEDYNAVITGPAKVLKPNGKPLFVYLPGVLKREIDEGEIYEIVHSLKNLTTDNRGHASGTPKIKGKGTTQARTRNISSSIIGAMEGNSRHRYCRLTAWTGKNLPQWKSMQPFLKSVAEHLEKHVPDRYAAQQEEVGKSHPEWVVPGTPFTTVSINNSYPTGVHTDKGDLEKGFSTIACIRKGNYTGGRLCFPEWRVALDLQHGDLICMDAHDWHGNTMLVCQCGENMNGPCRECGDERISIVSYFRENITECGTADEEYDKATQLAESRTNKTLDKQG